MAKARIVEIYIKRLTQSYGLAPRLVWQIQIAVISFITLYGAELRWKKQ